MKRFLISEEEKNKIKQIYQSKKINLFEQTKRWANATCATLKRPKAECNDKVLKAQIKMNDTCPSDKLPVKLTEDGLFGTNTSNAWAVCKTYSTVINQTSTTTTTTLQVAQQTQNQPSPPQIEIKTVEQAQAAIQKAREEAERVKKEGKVTREICKTVAKAINPFFNFRKGVASQELCDTLYKCFDLEKTQNLNLIGRKLDAFEGCTPFKRSEQPTVNPTTPPNPQGIPSSNVTAYQPPSPFIPPAK